MTSQATHQLVPNDVQFAIRMMTAQGSIGQASDESTEVGLQYC